MLGMWSHVLALKKSRKNACAVLVKINMQVPDYFLDHDNCISLTYFQISFQENPDINYFLDYEPIKQEIVRKAEKISFVWLVG
jgi:hypothetical protein